VITNAGINNELMPPATIRGKFLLKTVIIFGSGSGGKRVISSIPPDTRVSAFCDNDDSRVGRYMHGIPVVHPKDLPGMAFDEIIIASEFYEEICEQLLELYVPAKKFSVPSFIARESDIDFKFLESPIYFQPFVFSNLDILGTNIRFATSEKDRVLGAMLREDRTLCSRYLAELAWLRDQILPDTIFLDVGGNLGSVSIYLSKQQPSAQILAFEPDPLNFSLFQINLHANHCNNITVFNTALGSGEGHAELHQSIENYGDHRTTKPQGNESERFKKSRHLVSMTRGSKLLFDLYPNLSPNIIKIDTQGGDFVILSDILDHFFGPLKVAIEFSPYHLGLNGSTGPKIMRTLREFDEIFVIEPSETCDYNLVPISEKGIIEYFENGVSEYNGYIDLVCLR
jgi:FkbM family methyltransferase